METIIGILSIVFVLAVLAFAGYFNLQERKQEVVTNDNKASEDIVSEDINKPEEKEEMIEV